MDEGRGAPPQTPEPVTAQRWEDLPEANRRVAVHWLAVMAGKAVRAVRAASGPDPRPARAVSRDRVDAVGASRREGDELSDRPSGGDLRRAEHEAAGHRP